MQTFGSNMNTLNIPRIGVNPHFQHMNNYLQQQTALTTAPLTLMEQPAAQYPI